MSFHRERQIERGVLGLGGLEREREKEKTGSSCSAHKPTGLIRQVSFEASLEVRASASRMYTGSSKIMRSVRVSGLRVANVRRSGDCIRLRTTSVLSCSPASRPPRSRHGQKMKPLRMQRVRKSKPQTQGPGFVRGGGGRVCRSRSRNSRWPPI